MKDKAVMAMAIFSLIGSTITMLFVLTHEPTIPDRCDTIQYAVIESRIDTLSESEYYSYSTARELLGLSNSVMKLACGNGQAAV